MVREGRVFISPTATRPQYGIGYYVTAYEVGAQVAAASSGTTATVRAGHGFAASDKLIVGTDSTLYRRVVSVTPITLVLDSVISLADGDLLVNLGVDTGSTAPNYDGSGVDVYTDMDYSNVATYSTVLTDSYGKYRYFYRGLARWELVRDSTGTPITLYPDTGTGSASSAVSVKDYGATGDGVTDDTVSIQSALNVGGRVFIPGGTYMTSSSLYVKSDTSVYGEGIGITTIKLLPGSQTGLTTLLDAPILAAGDSVGVRYTLANLGSNITVSDLTLDCDYSNQTRATANGGCNCLRFAYVDGVNIQRIEAKNCLETGIEVTYSNNVLIESNVVSSVGKIPVIADANGIGVYYGHSDGMGQNTIIAHNRISDVGVSGAFASEGIATFDLDYVTISGNDIGTVINGAGVEVNVSAGLSCVGYNINGNNIHDCSGQYGLGITASAAAAGSISNMVVTSNSISNVTNSGIYIGSVSDLSVSSNTVYNSNTSAHAIYFVGIDVLSSSNPSVSGNVVSFVSAAATVYGLRLYACTNGRLSDNTVKSPSAACVVLNVGSQGNFVSGNRLVGGTYGVQILNSGTNSSNVIYANHCSGQSTSAYSDTSGQTNYSDGLDSGSLTVPGTLTGTGLFNFSKTTGIQQIQTNSLYLNDGTDRDAGLYFNTLTADGVLTYKGGSATNLFEFNKGFRMNGTATELLTINQATELLTLSTGGTTTNTSASLLPAGALILAVVARVTTTITTATNWKLGDSTTSGRFCAVQSGPQLTVGATVIGMDQMSGAVTTLDAGPSQAAAATVRVTTTGTPGAGAIRITVHYISMGAPVS